MEFWHATGLGTPVYSNFLPVFYCLSHVWSKLMRLVLLLCSAIFYERWQLQRSGDVSPQVSRLLTFGGIFFANAQSQPLAHISRLVNGVKCGWLMNGHPRRADDVTLPLRSVWRRPYWSALHVGLINNCYIPLKSRIAAHRPSAIFLLTGNHAVAGHIGTLKRETNKILLKLYLFTDDPQLLQSTFGMRYSYAFIFNLLRR